MQVLGLQDNAIAVEDESFQRRGRREGGGDGLVGESSSNASGSGEKERRLQKTTERRVIEMGLNGKEGRFERIVRRERWKEEERSRSSNHLCSSPSLSLSLPPSDLVGL